MNNYAPDQEPPTERIMLIDIGYNQYEGDYGHLLATVVRRAQPGIPRDTGGIRYWDGSGPDASIGLRNCSWSSDKTTALYVEDLQIVNQFDKRSQSTESPYGERVEFKPYKVEARDAKAMTRTFDKLDKFSEKLYQMYGHHPRDYAELVIRTALALGIRRFVVYRDGAGTAKTLVQAFREFGADDVAHQCEKLVTKARAGRR